MKTVRNIQDVINCKKIVIHELNRRVNELNHSKPSLEVAEKIKALKSEVLYFEDEVRRFTLTLKHSKELTDIKAKG
jgi:hypothetical protein